MKKKGYLLFGAVGLFAAACTTTVVEDEVAEVVEVTYTLDAENSSLLWKGGMSEEHSHNGTVNFSEGTMTMEDDVLASGKFVVDMTTIAEKDGHGLVEHLMGLDDNEKHKPADFFHTTKYPTVEVTLGEYKDGKLFVTLAILGQKLDQEVAVKITNDDKGAWIKGKFSMDLTSLNIPGLQADPETGEGISPSIDFDLNIAMTK
jgi:polyisoprenoid-binding protein YceI